MAVTIYKSVNQSYLKALYPFILVFKIYGIDLNVGLTLKLTSKLKYFFSILKCIIIICVVIAVVALFGNNVEIMELGSTGKSLAAAALAISLVTIFNVMILNLKRRSLCELLQRVMKMSYLMEHYQPQHIKKLKILSYFMVLSPYTCIIVLSLCLLNYFLANSSNDIVVDLNAILKNGISHCINGTGYEMDVCSTLVYISACAITVIWSTLTVTYLIHCIGLIMIFNIILENLYHYLQQKYTDEGFQSENLLYELTAENARSFIMLHKTISSVVSVADKVFQEINFVISAAEMLIIIMFLRSMDLTGHLDSKVLILLPLTFILTATFVGRTLYTGKVNYQVIVLLTIISIIQT